jgi:hypothetical protein
MSPNFWRVSPNSQRISQPLVCAPRFQGSPLARPGLRNLRLRAVAMPLRQVARLHRPTAVRAPRVFGIRQPSASAWVGPLVRARPGARPPPFGATRTGPRRPSEPQGNRTKSTPRPRGRFLREAWEATLACALSAAPFRFRFNRMSGVRAGFGQFSRGFSCYSGPNAIADVRIATCRPMQSRCSGGARRSLRN